MPTFSILLPVYNGEKYLSDAIESILSQTYTDFELLISDDCSVDNTTSILAQYEGKDKRIKIWRNPTQLGLFGNYNACLKKATGQFIKPFAQDDLLLPNTLELLQLAFIKNPSVAIVGGAREIIDDSGQTTDVLRYRDTDKFFDYLEVLRDNLLTLKNEIGEPSAIAFKNCGNAESGFDEEFYHLGDIDYWMRLSKNGGYYFLNQIICKFRHHSGSTTNKNAKGLRYALDMLKLGEKYSDQLHQLDISQETYARTIIDVSSSHLKYLAKRSGVRVQDLLSVESKQCESTSDFKNFKILTFYALLANAERLEEIYALKRETEAERIKLEDNLAKLMASRSWKVTLPLRAVKRIMRD
jgi:glycosyltransferase involved in cell wall biosynthesis